jgi:hypothetical protein
MRTASGKVYRSNTAVIIAIAPGLGGEDIARVCVSDERLPRQHSRLIVILR